MAKMRDLSIDLHETAIDTGYEYEMLVDRVEELVNGDHDMSWGDATEYICDLAYKGEL